MNWLFSTFKYEILWISDENALLQTSLWQSVVVKRDMLETFKEIIN